MLTKFGNNWIDTEKIVTVTKDNKAGKLHITLDGGIGKITVDLKDTGAKILAALKTEGKIA